VTLGDSFDRVYCIHLPNADRRKRIEAEFARVGIHKAQFIHAPTPCKGFTVTNMRRNPPAEFGCSLSHVKAVMQAIKDKAFRPLFLEDDVEFIDPDRIGEILCELPTTWDVLYMGGHPRGPAEMVSANLARISTFSFAEAYSFNVGTLRRKTIMESFVQFWLERISQPNAMFDIILGEFAAEHESYCIYPLMTFQPEQYSFIGNKIDNKTGCLEKGWQNNLSTRSP